MNFGAAGSAQSRRAESNTTSGRSCNSAVSIRTKSATVSFGARCRRRSAASAAAERLKSEKLWSRESTSLSECEARVFCANPALALRQNSRIKERKRSISLRQAQSDFIAEAAFRLGTELAECGILQRTYARFFKLDMALNYYFSRRFLVMQPSEPKAPEMFWSRGSEMTSAPCGSAM